MFPSTQPMAEPDGQPMRVQPGWRSAAARAAAHTALSSLSPSLLQDLLRFDRDSPQRELLEVLAAGVRHTQPLAVQLARGQQSMTLSVFPTERLVHCPMPMVDFLASDLAALQVLQVQPALPRPGAGGESLRAGGTPQYEPLGPLLWAVALRGSRDDLLPELAGPAAYRVAPGISLGALDVPGAMAACITRLRRQTSNLREIAEWQGIGVQRAMRLLNALYLQSGLIVSRSHPAATNEGWAGYDR